MGQLWQVVETNDTNHSIKLVTAHSLTSITYGETSDWNRSWARKWVNKVFFQSLEGTELVTPTNFCLDQITTPNTIIAENDNGDYQCNRPYSNYDLLE